MIPYDPNAALIGLHIPKTAGTSFRIVLDQWFPGDTLLLHYRTDETLPRKHTLRGGVCVYGHFNAFRQFGVADYYPEASQFFCFLREPFARFISLWRYLAPYGDPSDAVAFERWLILRGEEQLAGANIHSFFWYFPAHMQKSSLLNEKFIFVGLFERLQQSVDSLAARLGKPTIEIPHVNASRGVAARFEPFRPAFERYFADEMAFYETAKAVNAEMVASHAGVLVRPA